MNIKYLIFGRVQGVGFRYFTRQKALSLNVKGYVKNLTGGQVEVWAQANKKVLDAFIEVLKQGPRRARVEKIHAEIQLSNIKLKEFSIN